MEGPPAPPGPPAPEDPEAVRAADEVVGEAESIEPAEQQHPDLARQRLLRDLNLGSSFARNALRVMVAQVFIADAVFIVYGFANGWDIPTGAIQAWLGTALVQVIGVVVVITRYLFPNRDK